MKLILAPIVRVTRSLSSYMLYIVTYFYNPQLNSQSLYGARRIVGVLFAFNDAN